MDTKKLYDYAWAITVYTRDGVFNGSGVTVKNNCILTCAHLLEGEKVLRVKVRKVKLEESYDCKVYHIRPDWDLALLRLTDEIDGTFFHPIVSDNEIIRLGDELTLIGNPSPHVGQFGVGTVVTRCIHVDPETFKGRFNWANYKTDGARTKPYTTVGDLGAAGGRSKEVKVYHPELPLIGCVGMGMSSGASGAPLFRSNGELVGIHILGVLGQYSYAVHVSALKEFLKECDDDSIRKRRR